MTTITIAHRLQTVRHSDVIYVVERGRIATSGSYEYLMGHSEAFRAMAGQRTEHAWLTSGLADESA